MIGCEYFLKIKQAKIERLHNRVEERDRRRRSEKRVGKEIKIYNADLDRFTQENRGENRIFLQTVPHIHTLFDPISTPY